MKPKKSTKFTIKNVLLSLFALLGLWILVIFAQTAITQTRYNKNLITYAQQTHQVEKQIEAWRGKFYDRNGNELVSTRRSYDVTFQIKKYASDNESHRNWIEKSEVKDLAPKIAKILNYDAELLASKLNDHKSFQIEIGRKGKNLDVTTKNKLDALKSPGIHFTETTSRFYQDPLLGSMLFGYTNKDDDNKINGANGIEKYFNKELSGKDGVETYLVDKDGYKLPHSQTKTQKGENPKNVYLTIDQHIQSILEKEISSGQVRNNADWVLGVITDAKNNKVLGASASPGFNLETLNEIKLFNSPIANDAYEPGSVMKVFTWANAINKNKYNGEDKYLSGSIQVDNFQIKDHVAGGWGMTSYDEGFYRSSNVAAIKLTQQAGNNKKEGYEGYLNFLKKLGFGNKTGIEIADEQAGHIPDYTTDSEIATTTFGQNILVTPMQIMKALSVISSDDNGLYEPRIVEKINDAKTNQEVYKYDVNKIHVAKNVINAKTAQKVRDLMAKTVSSSDYNRTGTNFKLDDYNVGVKTGSAQIADEISKYSTADNLMLLSGLSIAPIDDPKINVYIAMKRPKSGQWDIPTMYRPIVKDVLAYLGTSQNNKKALNEDIKKVEDVHLPSLVNMTTEHAKEFLKSYGFKYIILGNGNHIFSQLPNDNDLVYTNQTVILNTSTKKILPDFTNLSEREVRNIAKLLNIKIKINGSGYVNYQSKPEKYELKKDEILELNLK